MEKKDKKDTGISLESLEKANDVIADVKARREVERFETLEDETIKKFQKEILDNYEEHK